MSVCKSCNGHRQSRQLCAVLNAGQCHRAVMPARHVPPARPPASHRPRVLSRQLGWSRPHTSPTRISHHWRWNVQRQPACPLSVCVNLCVGIKASITNNNVHSHQRGSIINVITHHTHHNSTQSIIMGSVCVSPAACCRGVCGKFPGQLVQSERERAGCCSVWGKGVWVMYGVTINQRGNVTATCNQNVCVCVQVMWGQGAPGHRHNVCKGGVCRQGSVCVGCKSGQLCVVWGNWELGNM